MNTPATNEFPSGVVKIAKDILRPQKTFFEIEMLEPGKNLGANLHMFFYTKEGWKMLGPVWRVPMQELKPGN